MSLVSDRYIQLAYADDYLIENTIKYEGLSKYEILEEWKIEYTATLLSYGIEVDEESFKITHGSTCWFLEIKESVFKALELAKSSEDGFDESEESEELPQYSLDF